MRIKVETPPKVEEKLLPPAFLALQMGGMKLIPGPQGTSITGVELVSGEHTPGGYDVYRINYSDGSSSTFEVYNGEDGKGASSYVHTQLVASAEWTISHNMGKYPSVSIVDSGDNIVMGDVRYIDENTVTVRFNGAFSGTAYLN